MLIPVSTSKYIGKEPGAKHLKALAAEFTSDQIPKTLYDTQLTRADASAYKVPDKTGGGYWIGDQSKNKAAKSADARFIAKTSYSYEYKTPSDAASSEESDGERSNDENEESVLAAEKTARTTAFAKSFDAPRAVSGPWDFARAERRVIEPKFEATTVYDQNFGKYGSDPSVKAKARVNVPSTGEFGLGTTRSTRHVPGYSGFINVAPYNKKAMAQSDGVFTRASEKNAMLPYDLDQYGRDRMPGMSHWRPQHPSNIKPHPPPCTKTTTGWTNHMTGSYPIKNEKRHKLAEDAGVMGFFTPGVETVSDNGKTNAQQFYKHVRPFEGCVAVKYPSKTTHYGTRFKQ